jgi:hypothetical protein
VLETLNSSQFGETVPQFGDLVKVPLPHDNIDIFGLVYDLQVRDDPAVRQLILAEDIAPEVMLDQRENRLVPIEISVLVVGYQQDNRMIQGLPPRPPLSLDTLIKCDEADLRAFTGSLDYLRLALDAAQLPADELVITNLQRAAQAYPPEMRRDFLVKAGRELVRLLDSDLVRLDFILRRIKPA